MLGLGQFGVSLRNMRKMTQEHSYGCLGCNHQRRVTYTPPMGNISVKINPGAKAFEEISIDPLGDVRCHPIKGSKVAAKMWPMIISCHNTGAIPMFAMEGLCNRRCNTGATPLGEPFRDKDQVMYGRCREVLTRRQFTA